jgi:regulator of sirC expression with transglutaminase-like and TPR domain
MASKVMQPVWPVSVQAEALAEFLFKKLGFQGNQIDYIDPRNSYLNEVLDRRLGIPISLAVVFIAVAGRLGLEVQGVGLPGHFIVRIQDPQGELYLDPFHGGRRLSKEDCAQLVILTTGYSGPFQEEWLAPSSPESILARMLTNLKNVYMKKEAWNHTLAVLERLRLVQPDLPETLRDLGLVYHQQGSLRLAVQYYEQYLNREPEAADAEEIKRNLRAAAQKLAQLN